MRPRLCICFAATPVLLLNLTQNPDRSVNRVTILVDAFGKPSALKMDWGFSAFVEYGGKRVLFDTGNNAEIFAHNVKALGIDLTRLDFVVISHRHGDHTSGLHHLLKINPGVKIYAPNDEHFGGPTPVSFYRRGAPSLPAHMRYFGGSPPENVPHGSAWKDAKITQVNKLTEAAPNIRLIPTISQVPGTMELPELSLSIQTPKGQIILAGCSHPGIEKILGSVSGVDARFRLIFGGFHLVTAPEAEIERVAVALRDRWKVEGVAPGHCTGEPTFATLQRVFDGKYHYAGLGAAIELP
jgi:7,8-dihydropterin-6-yl-methyl-4-(beta-D-ribofuranosyl)aminobenzene 5'-phosphate synthase